MEPETKSLSQHRDVLSRTLGCVLGQLAGDALEFRAQYNKGGGNWVDHNGKIDKMFLPPETTNGNGGFHDETQNLSCDTRNRWQLEGQGRESIKA